MELGPYSLELEFRGEEPDQLAYLANDDSCTPFTGRVLRERQSRVVYNYVSIEENYKDGLKHGLEVRTDFRGLKLCELNWKDGKKDGVFRKWHRIGGGWDGIRKSEEGNYKNGNKHGTWTYFNEDGKEKGRYTFKDGELVED